MCFFGMFQESVHLECAGADEGKTQASVPLFQYGRD